MWTSEYREPRRNQHRILAAVTTGFITSPRLKGVRGRVNRTEKWQGEGGDTLDGNLGFWSRDDTRLHHPGQEVAWEGNTLTCLSSSSSNLLLRSLLTKFMQKQSKRKSTDTTHTGGPSRRQSLIESRSRGQTPAHLLCDKQNILNCLPNKYSYVSCGNNKHKWWKMELLYSHEVALLLLLPILLPPSAGSLRSEEHKIWASFRARPFSHAPALPPLVISLRTAILPLKYFRPIFFSTSLLLLSPNSLLSCLLHKHPTTLCIFPHVANTVTFQKHHSFHFWSCFSHCNISSPGVGVICFLFTAVFSVCMYGIGWTLKYLLNLNIYHATPLPKISVTPIAYGVIQSLLVLVTIIYWVQWHG